MLERIHHDNGLVTFQSPPLRELGVVHAFTTRIGGVSRGPYASLNLGPLTKDPDSDANTSVAENYRRLRSALDVPRHVRVEVRQVHGAAVWTAPAKPVRPADAPEADAIITDRPGKLLTIRVADCVPLLLGRDDGTVVAAVHAGWRGIVAGVVAAAVTELEQRFDTPPTSLVATIGPSISAGHFEVGPEVAAAFRNADLSGTVLDRPGERPHIDLAAAVSTQLQHLGVTADRIDTTEHCTFGDADLFFSHRRDRGLTGRQAAVIARRP